MYLSHPQRGATLQTPGAGSAVSSALASLCPRATVFDDSDTCMITCRAQLMCFHSFLRGMIFPVNGGTSGKEPTFQCKRCKRRGFHSWEDPLEEGMATHSSVLTWRIPWTEEPSRLQSLGWQRLEHDWSMLARMHPACWCLKLYGLQQKGLLLWSS